MTPAFFLCLGLLAMPHVAWATTAMELASYSPPDAGFNFTIVAQAPVSLNKMNTFIVKIQPQDPILPLAVTDIRFDARMPQHNHGMVVKPKVTQINALEFQIDGVKFHMVGAWELTFVFLKGKTEIAHKLPFELAANH